MSELYEGTSTVDDFKDKLHECKENYAEMREEAKNSADDIFKLRRNFAKYLSKLYLANQVEIARLCDEELDRSGILLGYVREESAKVRP